MRLFPTTNFAVLIGALLVSAPAAGCRRGADRPPEAMRLDTLAYVGRATCATCHEEEARSWGGSYHDNAMDVATEASILGDFDDAVYVQCGETTRFTRQSGRFVVRTAGRGGVVDDHEVTHTFGVYPLQQYLVSFPDGRLQALTVAWDVEEEQWFSLYGDECVSHDDVLHWTGPAMNWNYMCADCHSTGLRRGFQLATNTYQTTFAEIDVSCEACHGPGELHVAWSRDEPIPGTSGRYGLTTDLSATGPANQEISACAPCHSRRLPVFPDFVPGSAYFDHYEPALLDADLYYADGQIQDEVYVYGSFLQSRMHAEGVRCTNCHDPHSTETILPGNALCTQCHAPVDYDDFSHHRHSADSEAASCVSCHMPERTYMVVDPRRDHSFRIPRPDLTASLGVPNACTGCHTDRPPQWAADSVRAWYGEQRSASFAAAVFGGRAGDPRAENDLVQLATSGDTPGIVRATALRLLQAYESDVVTAASRHALSDPFPPARIEAARTLERRVASDSLLHLVGPLLLDSVRSVRMEAARLLTLVPGSRAASARASIPEYWTALVEYREGQLALSDQAAAHLNLGVVHEQLGEWEEAEQAYARALRIDSNFVPAHLNTAMLLDRRRTGSVRTREADSLYAMVERSLRAALRVAPDQAHAHYALGLLLAERPEQLAEAAKHLDRAASLTPGEPRMRYNAGLAFQRLGERRKAEEHLLAAHALDQASTDYINALSIFYLQQSDWEAARPFTEELLRRYPQNVDYRRRLQAIND